MAYPVSRHDGRPKPTPAFLRDAIVAGIAKLAVPVPAGGADSGHVCRGAFRQARRGAVGRAVGFELFLSALARLRISRIEGREFGAVESALLGRRAVFRKLPVGLALPAEFSLSAGAVAGGDQLDHRAACFRGLGTSLQ